MELRHLRYFVAVAEELNVRRAARRLRVSQPPLTRQIRDLEEEVGVRLLERGNRGVTLTEAGKLFLEEARQILSQSARAIQLARAARRGEAGRLCIAFPPLSFDGVLSRVMRTFRKRFPMVQLEIREMNTVRQVQSLQDKRIDLGYCGFRQPDAEPELVFHEVRQSAMCLALPPGHSLAKRRRVALSSLANETFVAPPRRASAYYEWYMNLCRGAGFSPRIAQEADSGQSMLALVSAGIGIALVPETLRQFQLAEIEFSNLPPSTPRLSFHLVWRRDNHSPILEAFLQIFREQIHLDH